MLILLFYANRRQVSRQDMDSQTAFCPNPDCPAKGQVDKGNIRLHSQKHHRYKCQQCEKTFTQTKGTPFYRLRHEPEVVVRVVTLLAHGCPPQAIVAAFGLDERTVSDWQQRAAVQCQRVQEHLVEPPRDLGQLQADELRVRRQGGIVWMAFALQVSTRLWLGGAVGVNRTGALLRQVIERVRRCALEGPILFVTDGLAAYVTVLCRVFRERAPRTQRGRCRLLIWPGLLVAQVVKRYEQRRVCGVERRVKRGTAEEVEAVRQQSAGAGVLNTSYIERLNGTFRQRLTSLVRRTRALARLTATLEQGMWLVGTLYNFCTVHDSLRVPSGAAARCCEERTPAMAAGLTDHCWSVKELLSYRVPPSRWRPPRRRGRVSQAMKLKIIQWCT